MERLTVKQTADMLQVSEKTVYRWIRQGVIPTVRTQGRYRFDREELETWARYKRIGRKDLSAEHQITEVPIDFASALARGGVHHKLEGRSTEVLFRNAVARLDCADVLAEETQEFLVQQLLEREALVSTGIGNGIALPHPRQPRNWGFDGPVAAVYYLQKPLGFKAVDGKPVNMLVLLLCQSIRGHLGMLSHIAHLLNDPQMQKFLKKKPDATSLMEKIKHG